MEHKNLEESVVVAFTIGHDEYIRAMRRHYRSRLHVTRDIAGGTIAICGGLYLLFETQQTVLAWLLIIPGIMLLGIVAFAILLLPAMLYRSQPKLQSEYRLHFNDTGINFQTNEIEAQLKWQNYHSWICDDEFYILYHGKRDLSVIPRRSITGAGAGQFETLLTRHIGPCRTK